MKYIVYKTTNKVNNYIYIGVHHTNDDLKFDKYLGCGVRIDKPSSYEKSKTAFQKAVKEFGVSNFYRETIAVFDNEEDAYELEGQIVNESFLSRNDVYNMILGGKINHSSGIKIFKYDINGNFLKEFSSFQEAANDINRDSTTIRRAVLYKYLVDEKYYYNSDKLDKIDISLYNNIKKQKIYRYLKTGEFDCEFESYNEAARNSNSSPANIRKSNILGYCVKDSYYFSTIKEASFDKARTFQILTRPVYQYDINGNFLKEYKEQCIAEKEYPNSNITKSIKLKTADSNNFLWSLEKLPNFNSTTKDKIKKVGKFDDSGILLQTWDSARLCGKEVGTGVQNVLNGKYKKHKGFIYKYL